MTLKRVVRAQKPSNVAELKQLPQSNVNDSLPVILIAVPVANSCTTSY